MKEYNELSAKLSNGTITKIEKKRLFQLAFGDDFMKSNDKGAIKEY